jgi:DNA polymerase-3 subunit delta
VQIRPDDLARQLERGIAPLYVIHGDEPLIALEAGDTIRAAARAAGFGDREVLVAEPGFRWDAFLAANANLGLFGERKLVDLRLPSGKPGVEGAKALERYAGEPNPDNVTLITLPRVDRAAQNAPWFTALAERAVVVAVQPLERAALPGWIAARLKRQRQHASNETLAFLAEHCEGNLLAARQEIEKLALLLPEGELALADVEGAVADVARFDVAELSEAWLAGDAERLVRILAALEAEGEAITRVLWQLGEDLHALAQVHDAVASGTPLASAVRNARVWGRRQNALEKAQRRIPRAKLPTLLAELARLDALAKGLGDGDPWEALAALALDVAGHSIRAPALRDASAASFGARR